MVEYLNAVVADAAVGAPWRPIELASDAPFHPNRDAIDLHISVKRGSEVIISVLVRTCTRDHSRVHEGRHGEVDQDKECDDALEYRHGVPLLDVNVPLVTRKVEKQCCGTKQQKPCEGRRQKFSFGFAARHVEACRWW